MHAYEGHAYRMASVRNTPMRDTPIYIGWRKGVAFVAGGGVEYGSAGLSRSTRRCTYAGKRRCLRHYQRLGRAQARHTFPDNQPTVESLGAAPGQDALSSNNRLNKQDLIKILAACLGLP